jgi:CO/xanthine dehydrogenase FAD-binding subunit
MKPASFEYYAPRTIEEALDRIGEVGNDGGKILAGGQSLIPAMNFRLAQPTALVDLNTVNDLFYIKPSSSGGLMIGTMTRDTTVEFDPRVAEISPMTKECLPFLAHPQIRNRGTFGGALTHGDPAGQAPVVAVAQNFRMHIRSASAERWVNAEDFYVTLYTNVIEPDEMLVEFEIPKLAGRTGSSYKQTARQAGASATVGVAAVITIDEKNICTEARVAFMGVDEKPVLSAELPTLLVGQQISTELIKEAVNACVTKELQPGKDMHATPEFRSYLAGMLGVEAVTEAAKRARE